MSSAGAGFILVALFVLSLLLRLLPGRVARVGGADAWFHLLYSEALRRQRRLPVRLDRFLMEPEEQRYPPAFAAALALLPATVRVRFKEWISPAIDVAHLALLVGTAVFLGLPSSGVLLAALVYATTPTLTLEYSTLNPRSLASLLFTVTMLCLFASSSGKVGALPLGGLAGALLLLTSKMGAQAFAFTAVVAAVTWHPHLDAVLLALLAVSAAQLLSLGFYSQVLRAHAAILRYYSRHVNDLNAHQIYDSPLGDRGLCTDSRLYLPGIRGLWRLARVLVAHDPWVLLLPLVVAEGRPTGVHGFFVLWAASVLGATLVTTFVPPLRFLGEGYRYLKFGAFPISLLLGQTLGTWPHVLVSVLLACTSVGVIWRLLHARRFETLDDDFQRLLSFMGTHPASRVAVIPSHRSGAVAFFTRKAVLWGGYSGGYDQLEAWSPVLRKPLPETLAAYRVGLVLVDTDYVDPADLHLGPEFCEVARQGRFTLIERLVS
jgi:hypothetical protein